MSTNSSPARNTTSWRSRNCPHGCSLRVAPCPPRGLALLGAARRCGRCPHACSLRVAPCLPRGPLRLRPGKAGSAAPACITCPHVRSLRVTHCPPRGPLRLQPGKAGSAAPACMSGPQGRSLRVAADGYKSRVESRSCPHCHRHGWQWPVGDETVFASHRGSQKGCRFASALCSRLCGTRREGVDGFRVFVGKLEPAYRRGIGLDGAARLDAVARSTASQ